MSQGKVLGNRYKVGHRIGSGGFSVVYYCVDLQSQEATSPITAARALAERPHRFETVQLGPGAEFPNTALNGAQDGDGPHGVGGGAPIDPEVLESLLTTGTVNLRLLRKIAARRQKARQVSSSGGAGETRKAAVVEDPKARERGDGKGNTDAAHHRSTGAEDLPALPRVFAVKVLNKARLRELGMEEAFEREVEAMKTTSATGCMYVINIIDVLQSTRNYYLIMDLADQGSLLTAIVKSSNNSSGGGLSPPIARKYFRQLVVGLAAVHDADVAHRDIKPENLLLDRWRDIKISDFGFAAYCPVGRVLTRSCGTPQYAAPEVLADNPRYDGRQVDMWSTGVTLFVMAFGCLPFVGPTKERLFQRIRAGHYDIPKTQKPPPPSLLHLISVLVDVNPATRWTLDMVKRHPWVLGRDDLPLPMQRRFLSTLRERYAARRSQSHGHAKAAAAAAASTAKNLKGLLNPIGGSSPTSDTRIGDPAAMAGITFGVSYERMANNAGINLQLHGDPAFGGASGSSSGSFNADLFDDTEAFIHEANLPVAAHASLSCPDLRIISFTHSGDVRVPDALIDVDIEAVFLEDASGVFGDAPRRNRLVQAAISLLNEGSLVVDRAGQLRLASFVPPDELAKLRALKAESDHLSEDPSCGSSSLRIAFRREASLAEMAATGAQRTVSNPLVGELALDTTAGASGASLGCLRAASSDRLNASVSTPSGGLARRSSTSTSRSSPQTNHTRQTPLGSTETPPLTEGEASLKARVDKRHVPFYRRMGLIHVRIAINFCAVIFIVFLVGSLRVLFDVDITTWPLPAFLRRFIQAVLTAPKEQQRDSGTGGSFQRRPTYAETAAQQKKSSQDVMTDTRATPQMQTAESPRTKGSQRQQGIVGANASGSQLNRRPSQASPKPSIYFPHSGRTSRADASISSAWGSTEGRVAALAGVPKRATKEESPLTPSAEATWHGEAPGLRRRHLSSVTPPKDSLVTDYIDQSFLPKPKAPALRLEVPDGAEEINPSLENTDGGQTHVSQTHGPQTNTPDRHSSTTAPHSFKTPILTPHSGPIAAFPPPLLGGHSPVLTDPTAHPVFAATTDRPPTSSTATLPPSSPAQACSPEASHPNVHELPPANTSAHHHHHAATVAAPSHVPLALEAPALPDAFGVTPPLTHTDAPPARGKTIQEALTTIAARRRQHRVQIAEEQSESTATSLHEGPSSLRTSTVDHASSHSSPRHGTNNNGSPHQHHPHRFKPGLGARDGALRVLPRVESRTATLGGALDDLADLSDDGDVNEMADSGLSELAT